MTTGLSYDALSTVFVFLIGVPAIVLQSLEPEMRRVVFKRWSWLLFKTGVPLASSIAIVFAALVAQNIVHDANPAAPQTASSPDHDLIWAVMFAVLFILAAISALIVMYDWRPSKIIERLEKEAAKRVAREARLDGVALEDLIEVGGHSEKGQDKDLVLASFERLTERVCNHPMYRGDGLEALILGLPDILITGSEPGTLQNFRTAAGILKRVIMTKSAAQTDTWRPVDRMYSVHALSVLGQAALDQIGQTMDTEHTLMCFVQALGSATNRHLDMVTEISQALFEVGTTAIRTRRTLIALAALEELLGLVRLHCPATGELAADFLGLAADFWTDGETARQHIASRLTDAQRCLAQPLSEALELARQHYLTTSRFETADSLLRMEHQLGQHPLQ